MAGIDAKLNPTVLYVSVKKDAQEFFSSLSLMMYGIRLEECTTGSISEPIGSVN